MRIWEKKLEKNQSMIEVTLQGDNEKFKLVSEKWEGSSINSTELTLPVQVYYDDEIAKMVRATLQLVKHQKNVVDERLLIDLEEACLEFLKVDLKPNESCCENPEPCNAYAHGTNDRLKDQIVCDNCGAFLEGER